MPAHCRMRVLNPVICVLCLVEKVERVSIVRVTRCNLSDTILLKIVDSYLIALKFTKELVRQIASCDHSLSRPLDHLMNVYAHSYSELSGTRGGEGSGKPPPPKRLLLSPQKKFFHKNKRKNIRKNRLLFFEKWYIVFCLP